VYQPAFDKAPGVIKTMSVTARGTEPNPTYELVTSERTKYRSHRDHLRSGEDLLRTIARYLLKQINPTQSDGQFTDIGPSYSRGESLQ